MKTGILLPGSSTHPLLPHDFMAGFKGGLNAQQDRASFELFTAFIGYGTDEQLILREAEKLFMEAQIDVLLAFADEPKVAKLYPLVNALKKPLIVLNHGAKFTGTLPGNYVSFHTLNGVLSAYLTGQYAQSFFDEAILVSDYYDGAYSLSQAMVDGFLKKEDDLKATFILKHIPAEFDTSALKNYIHQQEQPQMVFTLLSGSLVPLFFEQMSGFEKTADTRLFTSSVCMEEALQLEQDLTFPMEAFCTWHSAIDTPENIAMQAAFKASAGREPNAVAALGWDTALILTYLKQQPGTSHSNLEGIDIAGAKGRIRFDADTKHFLSDQYLLTSENGKPVQHSTALPAGEILQAWKNIIHSHPNGTDVGWINTYLCS